VGSVPREDHAYSCLDRPQERVKMVELGLEATSEGSTSFRIQRKRSPLATAVQYSTLSRLTRSD